MKRRLLFAACLLSLGMSFAGPERGTIDGVTFRNIRITAPRMPPSLFRGLDEEHGCQ